MNEIEKPKIGQRYETERIVNTKQTVKALILETSSECRACNCPGCYMAVSGRNREPLQLISSEMAKSIFDLVKIQNGGIEAESVDLIGGEPMEPKVWPEVEKTIQIALDRGITPWLFTNGMFMTAEKAKWLLDKGVFVTMKLNIGNPKDPKQIELQAKMIGKNISAAKKLIKNLYTALDSGLTIPQLSVENLIRGGNNSNIPLVPEYYEFGLDAGFKPDIELMGNGEAASQGYFALAPTISQVRWIMDQIKIIRDKRDIEPITFLMPHITGSCPFYDTALYFRANGDIQPCSNNRTKLANINNDQNPIDKALKSDVITIRRNLVQSVITGPCGTCGVWNLCRGGCRATVESFGNPKGSYPLCGIQQKYENAAEIIGK
jgi:radical SAM protein with 4Fe4S-binding SPASM domain